MRTSRIIARTVQRLHYLGQKREINSSGVVSSLPVRALERRYQGWMLKLKVEVIGSFSRYLIQFTLPVVYVFCHVMYLSRTQSHAISLELCVDHV